MAALGGKWVLIATYFVIYIFKGIRRSPSLFSRVLPNFDQEIEKIFHIKFEIYFES